MTIVRASVALLLALALAGAAAGAHPQLAPGYGSLAWAPGSEITFGAAGGIYTVDPGSGRVQRLTSLGNQDSALAWSPDGRSLLFGVGERIERLDGARARRVASGFYPAWSPDGRRLAYGGVGGFHVARADGTGDALVAHSRSLDQAPVVVWSPDGRRLAFVACRGETGSEGCEQGSTLDVYVASASGGGRKRITAKTGFPQCPAWSSRGFLAWQADDDLTGVLAPGGGVRTFRPGGCPVWSPDGRTFVVTTPHGLAFLDGDGGGRRVVTPALHGGQPTGVAWSPDGKELAVEVSPNRGDNPTLLYVVRRDGSGLRRLSLPKP